MLENGVHEMFMPVKGIQGGTRFTTVMSCSVDTTIRFVVKVRTFHLNFGSHWNTVELGVRAMV